MTESSPDSLVGTSVADRVFIGGEWVRSTSDEVIDVVNPATECVIAAVPDGSADDADRAVRAAADAFEEWSARPVAERVEILTTVSELLGGMAERIAITVSAEVGTTIALSRAAQAALPALTFRSMAQLAPLIEESEEVGNSRVVRESAGVVVAITPWNYPLHQIAAKVAPALAAGCTVVLKPSEVAPLTALALARVCEDAGLPRGVLNVIQGRGEVVGDALVKHPLVDVVSFTGSVRAGRRIGTVAARDIKRTALELGGKSASVVLEDADLEAAVHDTVAKCFQNAGQSCNAHSRMLVPGALSGHCTELARSAAEAYVCGAPLDEGTTMGPLAADAQRERVRGYVREARAEGALLVTGGDEPPAGLDRGFYVRPTVFGNVRTGMRIAREEVFGPVLSVIPYDGEPEAVAIANDSDYGLSGAVWSGDEGRALDIARQMRTGQVHINGGKFNPLAPFGGFKQSGVGRELGRHGLDEFLEWKALHF